MTSLTNCSRDIPSLFFNTKLFDKFFDDDWKLSSFDDNNTKVDIIEEDDKLKVVADIPGFSKDNIKVEFEKGYLTMSGELKQEKEEKNVKYLRKEIGSKSFKRRFYLGDSFDTTKIDARFKDGMLKIDIPKSEKNKFKEIQIN